MDVFRAAPAKLDANSAFAGACLPLLGGHTLGKAFSCSLPGHTGSAELSRGEEGRFVHRCTCRGEVRSLAAAYMAIASGVHRRVKPAEYKRWKCRLTIEAGAFLDLPDLPLLEKPPGLTDGDWEKVQLLALARVVSDPPNEPFPLARSFVAPWWGFGTGEDERSRGRARSLVETLLRGKVIVLAYGDPPRGKRPGTRYFRFTRPDTRHRGTQDDRYTAPEGVHDFPA